MPSKKLLGHVDSRTEVYLHSSRTRTESAVRALGEYRRANHQAENRSKSLQNSTYKATSGFEPLYEALQASA